MFEKNVRECEAKLGRLVEDKRKSAIGVFDSGIGGLTVAKEINRRLPNESIIYFGDSLRCPYGSRDLDEVKNFVLQIGKWLAEKDVKIIVIACNSGTAAGLAAAQEAFSVPVIGVIEPGARAAVKATRNRKVGVIGTTATISSKAYEKELKRLDAGIEVYSQATPELVDIVENRLNTKEVTQNAQDYSCYIDFGQEDYSIVKEYLSPMLEKDIDSLVLGCTHFPILKPLFEEILEGKVEIISSAEEVASEIESTLAKRKQMATGEVAPVFKFATTTPDSKRFSQAARAIFEKSIDEVEVVSLKDLEII